MGLKGSPQRVDSAKVHSSKTLESTNVPDRPSIKGSVLVDLIEDLRKLRDEGRISQQDFENRLRPEDLEALDAPILPGI